ncbi:MAG TPA: tetratricopeptide repeat protein [Burkholderiales bacterium]|nr:tetratricopeptide repeat protein [Burkholderiales bacterium]
MSDPLQAALAEAAARFKAGDLASAGRICRSVVDRSPDTATAWAILGTVNHRQGLLQEALEAFRRAVDSAPGLTGAWNGCAAVLVDLGRLQEAEVLLRDLQSKGVSDPFTLANLANVVELRGDSEEALELYERALETDGRFFPALLNRGQLLLRTRRFSEALDNNIRLCAAYPDVPPALVNLAEVQLNFCRYAEALSACGRALERDPKSDKARFLGAIALAGLGRIDESQNALDVLRQAGSALPNRLSIGIATTGTGFYERVDARLLHLFLRYHEQEICDWSRRDEFVDAINKLAGADPRTRQGYMDETVPFMTLGAPIKPTELLALVSRVAKDIENRCPAVSPRRRARANASQRIRVGYVSADFRDHPTGYLTRRLYALHDRQRFEIYAYALDVSKDSPVARDIEAGCDVFRDVHDLDDTQIVGRMAADEIDIAVDLSGYSRSGRPAVFAMRPAPLQVNYLGFPCSLGADYVDYVLLDSVVCPSGFEGNWHERVVGLPASYLLTNDRERIDVSGWDRKSLGLPQTGLIFCCFNNCYKFDPLTFDLWMNVLRRVEDSVLWLYAPNEVTVMNLTQRAAENGIEASRLVFAPHVKDHGSHLGRYLFADLFLDTRYCNAHTTAVDALWCGVPVITVPGETMASRVGASLLNAAGLPELICKDWNGYEEKSVWLATHSDELAQLKAKLAANRGSCPLFDTEGQVRALEAAFEEMWRRHQAGLPPESFNVKPLVNKDFRNAWH